MFRWMELIHPSKFQDRKKATVTEQRVLINDVRKLYPFAVRDLIETEHNLHVLYNNKEIARLLQKVVTKRDALIAKKRRIENVEEAAAVEENDEFEMQDNEGIVEDCVKEAATTVQDLLSVIKKAELEEALPQAMNPTEAPSHDTTNKRSLRTSI